MCDTFVALESATADRSVILAKSADCQINEAHALFHLPRQKHVSGESIKTTYALIPQAPETYEVILSKSFWTYGAEIGINEYGLAIGNEAVFTTLQNEEKTDGIIGIDFLRLALERSTNCRQAIDLIGSLLEAYGQGGNCELEGYMHFDINYLMADPKEAWILETAGRKWAARQVDSLGSISNAFILEKDWDLCSVPAAPEKINWAEMYGDAEFIPKLGARERQCSSYNQLAAARGKVTVKTMFDILRDHGDKTDPVEGDALTVICAHAGPPEYRLWQATGAMVARLDGEDIMGWFTGTSGTCLSIFKPIFMGVDLPDIGPVPVERYDPKSLWWKHERLHRRAMADFETLMPEIRSDFDQVEAGFLAEASSVLHASPHLKREFTEYCFRKADYETSKWIEHLEKMDLKFKDPAVREMWKKYNAMAALSGMPA
jgi:secernin